MVIDRGTTWREYTSSLPVSSKVNEKKIIVHIGSNQSVTVQTN